MTGFDSPNPAVSMRGGSTPRALSQCATDSGASLRRLLVVVVTGHRIGVSFDANGAAGIAADYLAHVFERPFGIGPDGRRIEIEEDGAGKLNDHFRLRDAGLQARQPLVDLPPPAPRVLNPERADVRPTSVVRPTP